MLAGSALSPIPDKSPLFFAAYPRLPNNCPIPSSWTEVRYTETIDALVVTTRNVSDSDLEALIRRIDDPFLPIISLVEDDRSLFDGTARSGTWEVWEKAQDILARLQDLPDSVRHSKAHENILLGRLYSRNAPLEPIYNPALLEVIDYPVAGLLRGVPTIANQLVESGHLERRFFDRMYICPDCCSSILSVREECHSCRSAHLAEESIIHHFRCGHEARENTYRVGGRFECPKCGDALRHIGLDYDKPGSMLVCQSCGKCDDGAAVGFVCLACGRHHDTERMTTRDSYSYQITSKGVRCLLDGSIGRNLIEANSNRFGILLDFASREQTAFGEPFHIARLKFTEADRIRGYSARLWNQLRQLVDDGLHSAIRDVDAITELDDGALILLPRTTQAEALLAVSHIRQRLSEILRVDPGINCELLPPSEIRQLLGS